LSNRNQFYFLAAMQEMNTLQIFEQVLLIAKFQFGELIASQIQSIIYMHSMLDFSGSKPRPAYA